MLPVLSLVTISLVVVLSYAQHRDALYPPVIHGVVWLVALAAFELSRPWIAPLPPIVYAIVVGSVLTLSLGCYLACYGSWQRPGRGRYIATESNRLMSNLLLLIALAGLPFYVSRGVSLGASGPFANSLHNIRLAVIEYSVDRLDPFGFLSYLIPVAIVAFALKLASGRSDEGSITVWIAGAVASTYAVVTSGRTYIVMVVLLLVGYLMIDRRISPKKGAVVVLVVGLGAFVGLGYLVGKIGGGGWESAFEQTRLYLVGGLPALGSRIEQALDPVYGANTLRSVFAVAAATGVDVDVPGLIQGWAYVPAPTNVYTVFQPYYDDFGVFGVLMFPFFLGLGYGYVYRRAVLGDVRFKLLYAFSLYPLLLQFFQDQYVTLLSMWIQMSLLLAVGFIGQRKLAVDDVVRTLRTAPRANSRPVTSLEHATEVPRR